MKKSLKKEQVSLLKLEKELIAVAASVATVTSAARAEELLGETYIEQTGMIKEAYLNLVQTLQSAHDVFETHAVKAGASLLEARGGPKTNIVEAVKSVLGIS